VGDGETGAGDFEASLGCGAGEVAAVAAAVPDVT
jgi:hypothetical protein